MTSIKTLKLQVPNDYQIDPWLSHAKPEEVALVLDLASRLPRVVGDEKNEIASKLDAARNDGTNIAIRKVLEEASHKADAKAKSEIQDLQIKLENMKTQRDQLQEINQKQEKSLLLATENIKTLEANHRNEKKTMELELRDEQTKLIKKYEHDLMEKEHNLNMELSKIKAYEQHIEETSNLKISAMKRDITLETAQTYQALREEHIKLQSDFEQLVQDVENKVSNARREEQNKSLDRENAIKDQHTAAYNTLCAEKLSVESKLLESLTQKCTLTEDFSKKSAEDSKQIAKLTSQIVELQKPMGRGNAGEFDVAQTLRDLGFNVEDTSDGEKKEAGYLDLFVTLSSKVENMRLAIEIKNKQTIKKASDEKVKKKQKDLDDDVKTFQQRVKDGIKNNLFDGAIFVSIRAHTKMGSAVVLEMFEDTTNRALAPVSYVGPEKGKNALPLTQEQLETQVYMMFCVLDQCHNIRKEVCNDLKDDEVCAFQTLFDEMGSYLNKTFTDLRKQENMIQDMTSNLTNIRVNCIKMFRSIYQINGNIPWLQRKMDADWIPVFETAKNRAGTMNDADVWNRVSKHKATIENTIGKEAMLLAIHGENENVIEEPSKKKPKTT